MSLPAPACRKSSPEPPWRKSDPEPAKRLSAPAPPKRKLDSVQAWGGGGEPARSCRRSLPAPPCNVSRPGPPHEEVGPGGTDQEIVAGTTGDWREMLIGEEGVGTSRPRRGEIGRTGKREEGR